MKIFGDVKSGNCYKVGLTCDLLGIEYQWIDVDILAGDTQSSTFLQKNPNGKIPFIELDDGQFLTESNAIINYIARDSALYPTDALQQAYIQQWQFFEQYSHEPFIAVARFIQKYLGLPAERKDEYLSKQKGGYKALSLMNEHLKDRSFFVNDTASTADISLFAYTHVAHEGGFDLSEFRYIQEWIRRIEALNGYSAMVL